MIASLTGCVSGLDCQDPTVLKTAVATALLNAAVFLAGAAGRVRRRSDNELGPPYEIDEFRVELQAELNARTRKRLPSSTQNCNPSQVPSRLVRATVGPLVRAGECEMYWNMDEHGVRLNAMQAEAKLYDVLINPDITVVEQFWDDLHALDLARNNVQPSLKWVAIINHRDQLVNSELWQQMSDKMKAWCIVLDDAEIDAITREVIRQYMLDYDEHREETMT